MINELSDNELFVAHLVWFSMSTMLAVSRLSCAAYTYAGNASGLNLLLYAILFEAFRM